MTGGRDVGRGMRVLISAYACETGRGSEGEIAWRLVHRLAEQHSVWVITRANLRPVHEVAFAQNPKPDGLHFIYFDLPWIFRFYKRRKRFFLVYYYLWQIGIGMRARRMVNAHKIDVLHHLTGGMDWMPAGLALCPGPLIWGPVGSENTYPEIRRNLTLASYIKDIARVAVRWVMRNVDPFVRLSGARAQVVLTHTIETMPRRYIPKMRPFVQTGIENTRALAQTKSGFARGDRLQLVFAGDLKDWKGARLALDAALRFFEAEPEAELTIIGDGPLYATMKAATRAHRHGDRVTFSGSLPMRSLLNTLRAGDVFLYPSFHHGMATVVLQAMLTGLPIVCIEGDATARAVGQEAGISVKLHHGRDPVEDMADALRELSADEPRRRALACAARNMAREQFSYDKLAGELVATYRQMIGAREES